MRSTLTWTDPCRERARKSFRGGVYEEIALRKTATDRVETVRDTVRKEEVEIVQVPGTETTKTTTGPAVKPTTPKI